MIITCDQFYYLCSLLVRDVLILNWLCFHLEMESFQMLVGAYANTLSRCVCPLLFCSLIWADHIVEISFHIVSMSPHRQCIQTRFWTRSCLPRSLTTVRNKLSLWLCCVMKVKLLSSMQIKVTFVSNFLSSLGMDWWFRFLCGDN